MPHHDTAPGQQSSHPPISRWCAARFVAVFLALTLALLAAGRYAVNTRAMNWYLYQVARQTAFVLDVVGESGYVEMPNAYEGRAGAVRAELDAWRRGEEPTPGATGNAVAPLTAYEVWTHRAMKLAHDLRTERTYLAMTALAPHDTSGPPSARAARVREDYRRLEASMTRGSAVAARIAPKEVIDIADMVRPLVKTLENGAGADDATIARAEGLVATALAAQRAFLDERVRTMTAQVQEKLGPQVTFVARGGGDAARRFTFSLVPDCGALPSMSIYLAALIAFPAPFRKRLLGLAAGVPVLYAINLARLVCLATIGAYWREDPAVFEFAHQYVWQAVYVLIVVGVWLLWVELIVRPGTSWQTDPTSAA